MSYKTSLAVVICTYNPRDDLITRTLRALSVQTMPAEEFDLVVVDNNSTPALNANYLSLLAGRSVRVVVEPRQGLTFARVAGINATRSDVICFVDDDNELSSNYLERVVKIAESEPYLGTYGGRALGRFEVRVGHFQRQFLPFLGIKDHGLEPQTGSGKFWGEWEPIGAGLCVRRKVCEAYVEFVEQTEAAGGLGRRGRALLSGEDSLISRIADRLGYKVGYRPILSLEHHITAPRLKWKYLARLMSGHGRSHVILEQIAGRHIDPVTPQQARRKIIAHFLYRLKSEGLIHAIGMSFWDLGHFRQSRDLPNISQDLLGRFDEALSVDANYHGHASLYN